METPRPEYPRPQFVREDWLCLNGEWQFEIDPGDSGLERGLLQRELRERISVPFCPESALSGVQHSDFMQAVWYRKLVTLPQGWAGRRVLLHFQAVDYDATVWVNGQEVGRHRGGFSPFSCDLHGVAAPGECATIVLRARDDPRGLQPRGKQSQEFGNHGCMYTRTTGIWQSVWLEPVPEVALKRPRLTPNLAAGSLRLDQALTRNAPGTQLRATLSDQSGIVCSVTCAADADLSPSLTLEIPRDRRRCWSVDDPHLYDVSIELLDSFGKVIDRAKSYAGLRSVTLDGPVIKINGTPLFQRLVLDQGYYPNGILTAPSDEALVADIRLSQAAGFNGARLHQKVFEERFLYHADRMGYLVWGEFADWGCRRRDAIGKHEVLPGPSYLTEWLEVLERDYSHPCIVGWCPLNETSQPLDDRIQVLDTVTRGMFLATKAMDATRPVLDASGYSHRVPETDVYDCHDYEQDPAKFKARQAALAAGRPYLNGPAEQPWNVPYRGQPFFVSEFGGIWWNPEAKPGEDSWGYGERVKTLDEFYARFEGLCAVLLENPLMFGYCYTQLTDVYQEQNGIYTFDRHTKFDLKRIAAAQRKAAAIERTR